MLELNYPVLKYTPKFIRGSIQTEKDLLIVGEKNLDEGCFRNAVIIDSCGFKFDVLSAKKRRLTLNPFNVFYEYRTVWVDIDIAFSKKMNIEEIKNEILEVLLSNPSWYRKYGETERDLRLKFDKLDNIKEVIEKISIYP